MFRSRPARLRWLVRGFAAAFLVAAAALPVPVASAGPGYELDPSTPSIALTANVPTGIAIDQVSQNLYVAELATSLTAPDTHGLIEQFTASGVPTANSPFGAGGTDFFTGVAVNPVNQSLYAAQTELRTSFGNFGVARIDTFSPAGVLGTSFATGWTGGPQIAADSLGRIYYPNDTANSVQVFSSSGVLESTIACTGCPGGAFGEPDTVALDPAGNLYVVDIAAGGRVIKFKQSGGSYAYESVLQSGKGAAAFAIDPTSGDFFVGDVVGGNYHVVAYDSSGVQFDDFGGGTFGAPFNGSTLAGQIAVNATTRKVYVSDSGSSKVWVFRRVASIPAPTATTAAASAVGQVEATLQAAVNPRGHGLIDCHFEYTGDADFQANGFSNAVSVPCSEVPEGTESAPASTKVAGLTPAATYDYRIVVASNGGPSTGAAKAFTTLAPLPPSVTTGSASAITQTAATIAGTVNPRGGPVSNCHLEYVKDADFQESGFAKAVSVNCTPVKPSGTANVNVTAKLTGLTAGTGYRFRVLATNNSGTSEGLGQTFATAADTCATNPALCPPPEKTPETPTLPAVQPPVLPPTTPPVTTKPPKPLKCRKGFQKKRVHGKVKCVKKKHRKRA